MRCDTPIVTLIGLGLFGGIADSSFAQTCATAAYPNPLATTALDANARYGASVAISQNRAIVGAPDEDGGKGAAFIHEFDGVQWSAGIRIQPGDGVALDRFGTSVAIDGDWALIGSPDDDDNGVDAGTVYVYHRTFLLSTFVWLQTAKLQANDTVAGDRFGAAVAAKNGRAVIGAPNDNIVFFHQGSAYAFELSAGTWGQLSKLTAGGSQVNENFGSVVAIDGDHIAVGGPGYDNVSPSKIDSGRVGMFLRLTSPSLGWFLDTVVAPSDPVTSGRYGSAVALDGIRLFVGAPGASNLAAVATGASYVYETVGVGAWLQKDKLLPSGAMGDLVGSGVAVNQNRAYVAAKDSVFAYEYSAGAWSQKGPLSVPFADFLSGAAAKLSSVLAMNSTHLIVGRPSTGAGDLGSAFPFAVCGGTWSVLGTGTLGTGGIPKLRGAGPLDDGLPLELRMKFGKPNAASVLVVHVGAPGALPFHGGTLFSYPADLTISLPLSATGELVLPANLPAGLVNVQIVMQMLISDPLANGGVALSNGISAVTAP